MGWRGRDLSKATIFGWYGLLVSLSPCFRRQSSLKSVAGTCVTWRVTLPGTAVSTRTAVKRETNFTTTKMTELHLFPSRLTSEPSVQAALSAVPERPSVFTAGFS